MSARQRAHSQVRPHKPFATGPLWIRTISYQTEAKSSNILREKKEKPDGVAAGAEPPPDCRGSQKAPASSLAEEAGG